MTNPYILPDGNVAIAFSGGRTSAYMLHQILEANGDLPDRARVVFANTGREFDETLDFVQECSDRWNVNVVWVEDAPRDGGPIFRVVNHNSASRNGEPFEDLIRRKKAVPNIAPPPRGQGRFCTENLKYLPSRRYLISIGWKKWTNAIGIRQDESGRAKPGNDKRIVRWFPLLGVSKQTIMEFWSRQPFDLRVRDGFSNCDGCFLRSEASLATLAREYPRRHAWWERMEREAGHSFRSEYTRKELRRQIERQGDLLFSVPGALCQADGGECFG